MAKHQYATKPPNISTMPPGVPYIIGNEAAERFSFYGMRSILIVFMTTYMVNKLGMPDRMGDAEARGYFSLFVSAVYFLPILGAVLAECFLGKYNTIFWLSIVYCAGHFALALNDTRLGLMIGLGLDLRSVRAASSRASRPMWAINSAIRTSTCSRKFSAGFIFRSMPARSCPRSCVPSC